MSFDTRICTCLCVLGARAPVSLKVGAWQARPPSVLGCPQHTHTHIHTPLNHAHTTHATHTTHTITPRHLPRFYGLGVYDPSSLPAVRASLFSVEAFAGGRSLRALLSESCRSAAPLYDMASALRWGGQVAGALAALHELRPQYIHGDGGCCLCVHALCVHT